MASSSRALNDQDKGRNNAFNLRRSLFPKLSTLELGFLLLCFCVYCFWALTFTGWSYGPDEYMRYDIPLYIYTNNALPTGPEESIRNSVWGISYGFDMPVSYLIAAGLMKLTSLFTTDSWRLFIAARFTSVLATVGMVYFSILFSKKAMKDSPLRWVFIVLMALLPQIVFLSSYFNLDSYELFSVMMILYAWTVCLERDWDRASAVLLAVSLGLCLLGYQFSYGYVLATFFLYITWYLMNRKSRSFGRFIRTGVLILIIVFAVCGWRYVRNAILYDGDFLSLHASQPYAELYAVEAYKPSVRMTFAESGKSMWDMLSQTEWVLSTYQSLIATFGYMSIWLPQGYYDVYRALFIIGFCGLLFKGVCHILRDGKDRKTLPRNAFLVGFWMLFASVISIFLSVYYSWSSDYQAQGRYIISITPLLFSMVMFGMEGWIELISGFFRKKSEVSLWLGERCALVILAFVLMSMFEGYIACLNALGFIS